MITRSPGFLATSLLVMGLILSQCDTAEERAERHFQSGVALLEEGDEDRAIVEFRNVFELNPRHRTARETFAEVQIGRGNQKGALRQYRILSEMFPNDFDILRRASDLAIRQFDWDFAESSLKAATAINSDDTLIKSMNAVLLYRGAVEDKDNAKKAEAIRIAEGVLETNPEDRFARQLLIDQLLGEQKLSSALEEINKAIELEPDDLLLHELKLRTLLSLNDSLGVGEHLESMYKRFPENEQIRTSLFQWYMQQGDIDSAEVFLRDQASEQNENAYAANIAIVQFLATTRGADSAKAELETLSETDQANAPLYKGLATTFRFDEGETDQAITDLDAIVENAEPSDETRALRMTLARMLEETGNNVGAREQIEKVLEEDSVHVQALRQRAIWLIEDDQPGEAIGLLRTALEQDSRNAGVLTTMADAHLREGNRTLAGERLSLAVEVSNQGSRESLRYADFLMEDNNLVAAETVLIEGLRRSPQNHRLLLMLGDLYLQQSDFARARSVIEGLNALETDEASAAGNSLQNALLVRQEKIDESVEFLQGLIDSGDANLNAAALIVRSRLQNNEIDEAARYLDDALEANPQSDDLKFLRAGVFAISGDLEAAESSYRDILERRPDALNVIQTLYTLLRRTEREEEATSILDRGIIDNPNASTLLWIKAGELEASEKFEDAIKIYENLYDQDSSNLIVANNLASLITTHRDTDNDLERAFAIARRLKDTDVAPFQDTYGWIEYRRGNYDVALEYLEPAAEGLVNDPLVQYHLGMTYAAVGDPTKAKVQLKKALEMAGDSTLPQFEDARAKLEELESE